MARIMHSAGFAEGEELVVDHAGQHRWIEYVNSPAWYDVDASAVPAKWHAWLHYTVADPPAEVRRVPHRCLFVPDGLMKHRCRLVSALTRMCTQDNIASDHQKVPEAVLTNSDAPYKTNVGA